MVAIKADSGLHRAVSASRIFAVHIVGKSQKGLATAFFRGAEPANGKLNGYAVETGQTGAPLLLAPPAWFECRVVNEVPGGDHTIFVGEVVDAGVRSDEEALTLRETGFAYGG
jgi:flavin reductase (DIM6/NTAB) family NADH-FMN oxidoreductase RutF